MTRCRATKEGYVLDDEHTAGCDNPKCPGCQPCRPATPNGDPLAHCTARSRCSRHVAPDVLSCPVCVGKVRERLRRIVALNRLLPVAAVESGSVDSEAANLAGPATDPAGWSEAHLAARRAAEAAGLDPADLDFPEDDPDHPYLVLGRWDLMLREDYGPPTDLRITVYRAADYLDSQLDRLAQDPDQGFSEFISDVTACLAHLEAVLAVAERRETGAPCPACREAGQDKPPRLVLQRDDTDTTGAHDVWTCPTDRNHRWSDAEYRLRVGADYLDYAEHLTMQDMTARTRVAAGTLRRWASGWRIARPGRPTAEVPPLLKPTGRRNGRNLYRVKDVLALRDAPDGCADNGGQVS